MKQPRNSKGQYKRKYRLIWLIIALVLAVGLYMSTSTTTTIELSPASILPQSEPKCDDICTKQKTQRKFVEEAIKNKEQIDINSALLDRAEQAYQSALELYNDSVDEYNLTLEAMQIYGNGTLETFQAVAVERGLLSNND
jgi:hypothetical protein